MNTHTHTGASLFPCGVSSKIILNYGDQVDHVFGSDLRVSSLKGSEKGVISMRSDNADKWMLHHDNVPCHTALSVTGILTSKGIPVVPSPPIPLTTAPVTLSIFLKIKNALKGRHYGL